MFRRIVMLLAIATIAASCGGGEPDVTAGPAAPRALPVPDIEVPDEAGIERVSGAADGGCASYEQALTGDEGRALLEAATLGPDAYAAAFAGAFSGFGAEAEDLAVALTSFDGSDASLTAYADALASLDALTTDRCGFPGGGALLTMLNAMSSPSAFQCVDAVLGGDEDAEAEACGPRDLAYPDRLPCFESTGASWEDFLTTLTMAWRPVSCDTDEPVAWDHDAGIWATVGPAGGNDADASAGQGSQDAQDAFDAVDDLLDG